MVALASTVLSASAQQPRSVRTRPSMPMIAGNTSVRYGGRFISFIMAYIYDINKVLCANVGNRAEVHRLLCDYRFTLDQLKRRAGNFLSDARQSPSQLPKFIGAARSRGFITKVANSYRWNPVVVDAFCDVYYNAPGVFTLVSNNNIHVLKSVNMDSVYIQSMCAALYMDVRADGIRHGIHRRMYTVVRVLFALVQSRGMAQAFLTQRELACIVYWSIYRNAMDDNTSQLSIDEMVKLIGYSRDRGDSFFVSSDFISVLIDHGYMPDDPKTFMSYMHAQQSFLCDTGVCIVEQGCIALTAGAVYPVNGITLDHVLSGNYSPGDIYRHLVNVSAAMGHSFDVVASQLSAVPPRDLMRPMARAQGVILSNDNVMVINNEHVNAALRYWRYFIEGRTISRSNNNTPPPWFQDYNISENTRSCVILEWIVAKMFYALGLLSNIPSHLRNVATLKHAGPGVADIVLDTAQAYSAIEVTLLTSFRQHANEGVSIRKHAMDIMACGEGRDYWGMMFIAPDINGNTLYEAIDGVYVDVYDQAHNGLRIAPINFVQATRIFDYLALMSQDGGQAGVHEAWQNILTSVHERLESIRAQSNNSRDPARITDMVQQARLSIEEYTLSLLPGSSAAI